MTDFRIFKFAQFCHIEFIVIIERNHLFRAHVPQFWKWTHIKHCVNDHTLERPNEFWLAIKNPGVAVSF